MKFAGFDSRALMILVMMLLFFVFVFEEGEEEGGLRVEC